MSTPLDYLAADDVANRVRAIQAGIDFANQQLAVLMGTADADGHLPGDMGYRGPVNTDPIIESE